MPSAAKESKTSSNWSASVALPCATSILPLGASAAAVLRSLNPFNSRPSRVRCSIASALLKAAAASASGLPAVLRHTQNMSGSCKVPQTASSGLLFSAIRGTGADRIPKAMSRIGSLFMAFTEAKLAPGGRCAEWLANVFSSGAASPCPAARRVRKVCGVHPSPNPGAGDWR
jgi:hypothetical protein